MPFENLRRLVAARRVVVKVGSSLLVNDQNGELDQVWLDALVDDLVTKLSPYKANSTVTTRMTNTAPGKNPSNFIIKNRHFPSIMSGRTAS